MKTELSHVLSSVFTTLHVTCLWFRSVLFFAATILLVCMNLLTFQIRMKTAEDLKRFITTGFSNKKWLGSAHNITT